MKSTELLQRVIDSGVLAFEQDAPEKLESLEADICEFLKPAAHLTIPGALEWDGDNGTHGADGESRADGESDYDDAKEACAEIERAGAPGDVIREMNDELVDLRAQLDESNVVRQLIQAWASVHGRPVPWAKAVEITAVATKMPEDEKAALLALDDEPAAQYTAVDMTTAAAGGFRDGQTAATDSLKAFANEMIGAAFEGGSFDGGDIQDIAVKHGLLQIEQRTEECGEVCACREYGFPAECYRKTDLLKGGEQ